MRDKAAPDETHWRETLISRKRTVDEITELKDKRPLKAQIRSSSGWDELSCVVSDAIIKTLITVVTSCCYTKDLNSIVVLVIDIAALYMD